ncbi:hypothetical protein ACFCW2_08835 [Qipengyuania sp. DSG2-2]|uniref:hypothetical protein n=1 Tax=Qipengyuania sp. DGS2-2 TaxID=3349631 RepID=UPI0036D378FB
MGFLFFVLTFLAGVTIGTVEIALINGVVFLVLALLVVRFVPAAWSPYGVPFAMTGAFIVSVFVPYTLITFLLGEDCPGGTCTVTIEAPVQ